MIDFTHIQLVPATEEDYEFSYQVKKEAEGRIITEIFGWDEKRQRDFFDDEWQTIPRSIITYRGENIGTVSVTEDENGIHIRTFFLQERYQNQGLGSYLLANVLKEADTLGKTARLKFLKNNPAKSLYLRFGFRIIGEDKLFYSAKRPPQTKEQEGEIFMERPVRIGIIGDYDKNKVSHPATELSIDHASKALKLEIEADWLPTESFLTREGQTGLQGYDAYWISSGSPYISYEGSMIAIRFARESGKPFFAT